MISKTVFLKKVFARKTPKTPRVYQGLRRRDIEKHRTPEGDGTGNAGLGQIEAAKDIEKHRTPEGDGNDFLFGDYVPPHIEKHRTPEGDGNQDGS